MRIEGVTYLMEVLDRLHTEYSFQEGDGGSDDPIALTIARTIDTSFLELEKINDRCESGTLRDSKKVVTIEETELIKTELPDLISLVERINVEYTDSPITINKEISTTLQKLISELKAIRMD